MVFQINLPLLDEDVPKFPNLSKFADWLWALFFSPEPWAVWKLCWFVFAALNCPDDPSLARFDEILDPPLFWKFPNWFCTLEDCVFDAAFWLNCEFWFWARPFAFACCCWYRLFGCCWYW